MDHLTDTALAQYRTRTLPPADLLSADQHLSSCAVCRRRALSGVSENAASALLAGSGSPHLTYEEIEAYADARLSTESRARVIAHLDLCPQCRAEADDLCRFRAVSAPASQPVARWRFVAAAVAALAVAGFFGARALRKAPLPPDPYAGLVAETLRTGQVEAPAAVLALQGNQVVLRGTTEAKELRALAPVATAVLPDAPTFTWSDIGAGARYTVSVYDLDLRLIVRSEPVSGTQWKAPVPLPSGRVYLWQLSAERNGKKVSVPGVADPDLKFAVVDDAQAQALAATSKQRGGDHLLMGILYARAGLLDLAEREFAAASSPAGAQLLESAKKLRGSRQ